MTSRLEIPRRKLDAAAGLFLPERTSPERGLRGWPCVLSKLASSCEVILTYTEAFYGVGGGRRCSSFSKGSCFLVSIFGGVEHLRDLRAIPTSRELRERQGGRIQKVPGMDYNNPINSRPTQKWDNKSSRMIIMPSGTSVPPSSVQAEWQSLNY